MSGVPRHGRAPCLPRDPAAPSQQCEAPGKKDATLWRLTSPGTPAILSGDGANAEDAFHLVIPSLPGYGFSAKPTTPGWDPARIARAWDTMMKRLGYERYVSQGGDWGAFISEVLQRQAPEGLLGIHINFLFTRPPEIGRALALGEPAPAGLSEQEQAAYEQLKARWPAGYCYMLLSFKFATKVKLALLFPR